MRCARARSLLELSPPERLAPDERESLQAHLADCGECREVFERQLRLERLLAAATAPPPPEGLADRVMAAAAVRVELPHRQSEPSRWAAAAVRAATAAAVAAGLLVGVYLGRETWQLAAGPPPAPAEHDLTRAYGLDYLAGGEEASLAGTYLRMTAASEENGA